MRVWTDNKAMNVMTALLRLTVNGEDKDLVGPLSVLGLVEFLGLDTRKVAVELNREIVPRSTYRQVGLNDGDVLEIVHFIGGG
jgi:thiamine biosynthesis protein ThiS